MKYLSGSLPLGRFLQVLCSFFCFGSDSQVLFISNNLIEILQHDVVQTVLKNINFGCCCMSQAAKVPRPGLDNV